MCVVLFFIMQHLVGKLKDNAVDEVKEDVGSNVKMVIVLSVNGLLCYEEYDKFTPPPFNPNNIKVRPGLIQFFRLLFQYFHVGIWSCMLPIRLRKVMQYILPEDMRRQLLFVNGRNKCGQPGSYPYCFKKLNDLLRQRNAKEYCLPDKVLMVDDCRHRNVYNGDFACYFPISWMGERSLPNPRNVIPNICTALLPFIFDLRRYSSVRRFLEENEFDGKFKRKFLKPWHIKRVCIRSDHLVGLPVHDVKNG
jgi:hypothetical protein